MLAWWQMWQGELTGEVCDAIVAQGLLLAPAAATVGHGGVSRVDAVVRRSTVRWVPPSWGELRGQLDYYLRYANTVAFGFDLGMLREVQFTEYDAGAAGHYDWHEDLSWTAAGPCQRKLSVVVQLSDPGRYDGGDLQLRHEPPDAAALRTRGTVIVFPSFHPHRVAPVARGTRHSLVGWIDGPKFR